MTLLTHATAPALLSLYDLVQATGLCYMFTGVMFRNMVIVFLTSISLCHAFSPSVSCLLLPCKLVYLLFL